MDDVARTLKKIDEYFKKTPKEKLIKDLKKLEDSYVPCYPETCQGQCQGAGGCEVAVNFRKKHNLMFPSILGEEDSKDMTVEEFFNIVGKEVKKADRKNAKIEFYLGDQQLDIESMGGFSFSPDIIIQLKKIESPVLQPMTFKKSATKKVKAIMKKVKKDLNSEKRNSRRVKTRSNRTNKKSV